RILMASASPTAHSRRRTRSLASSGDISFTDGPSDDTRMRTWPLRVGCTTKLVSYTLVTAPPHRQSRCQVLGQRSRLLRPAGLAPVPHGHTPDARRRPTLSRTRGSRPPCGSTSSRHHV